MGLTRGYSRQRCFNPRLPGGRRPQRAVEGVRNTSFQSTPSGGKATRGSATRAYCLSEFQSTPSGGKATPARRPRSAPARRFNPRLPGGRRPRRGVGMGADRRVSIHAFRGEGDLQRVANTPQLLAFQSTPSGGKATGEQRLSQHCIECFNPRLPGGRRPWDGSTPVPALAVSIHAFRGEGDPRTVCQYPTFKTFQSTPSGGKATRNI